MCRVVAAIEVYRALMQQCLEDMQVFSQVTQGGPEIHPKGPLHDRPMARANAQTEATWGELGEHLDLHPVTILLFLMFWGLVWGIAGMFLAVPITAILKIILSRIEQTKPVAELLAGRLPA